MRGHPVSAQWRVINLNDRDRAQHLINWIHGARQMGKKNGLQNMHALMDALGHPERAFRSVHVAGTNGKGSTCAMVERALRAQGLRTGLYTSPYLCHFSERMRINGVPALDSELAILSDPLYRAFDELTAKDIHPTTFELGTALAYMLFRAREVDIAVIEVGLGGRLDPTNIITPDICAIAEVGFDHTHILGHTPSEIAFEKAGIIKPGVPIVLYPQAPDADQVFERVAKERNAPLIRATDFPLQHVEMDARGAQFQIEFPDWGVITPRIHLAGAHQVENARLALVTLNELSKKGIPLDPEKALNGLAATEWPGRLEWLNDHLLIDGAHNPEGAMALSDYLHRHGAGRRKVLLTAMMKDKHYDECAGILADAFDEVVTTKVDWSKALSAAALASAYQSKGIQATPVDGIEPAYKEAVARAGDGLVVVAGSLYLVGDVRTLVIG